MKKVGEILKQERLKQNKTLEDISKITKIQPELISALEEAEYNKLPDQTYIRGFVISYARALEMQDNEVLPFYRREVEQKSIHQVNKIPIPIGTDKFKLTPTKIVITIVSVILTVFLIMLFLQYRNFAGVPVLNVTNPPQNTTTGNSSVEVSGFTDPEALVTINGENVPIEINGYFSILYQLNPGANRIKIVATSKLNRESIVERIVEYNPQAEN